MRDLRRYWMNHSTVNYSTIFVLFAAGLLAACDRTDTATEVPLPETPAPQFSNGDHSPNANPFTFVGREDDCASPPTVPDYPAGSRIVSAAWLGGMGLPDNGGSNVAIGADAPNKDDAHYGLLLSKNGATPICASAGATINGVRGMVITAANSELGYDNRNGGHCDGGATRFIVVVKDPVTNMQSGHNVGACNNGRPEEAPQDPLEWTRWRFETANPTHSFPVIPPGSIVVAIFLLYDEGTDQPSPVSGDLAGVGLAVLDNIFIFGQYIRSGGGIAFGAGGLEKNDSDADGLTDDADSDDDNDGIGDLVDTDDNGDGIEDALDPRLTLPV